MITLQLASPADLTWCQALVTKHHYLHAPVDTRCAPLAYVVLVEHAAMLPQRVGCLIFGRPEATRCYSGGLTYGSMADVRKGRAQYDRWEILNLARVWLSPRVQAGGIWCRSSVVPGFVDRRGLWRSTVASSVIEQAIERVGYDYLMQRLPGRGGDRRRHGELLAAVPPRRRHRRRCVRLPPAWLLPGGGERIERG